MTKEDIQHQFSKMQSKITALENENQALLQALETQKKEAEIFTTVAKNMLDMIAVADMEGNFTFAGKAHEILGYDPNFLTGKNIMGFVHPEDLPHVLEKFNNILTSGGSGTAEYRYRCKDGNYVWLETVGKILKDEENNPQQIIFNSRDITLHKHAEDSLRKNKTMQDKMLANIGDVIVIIDKDGINRYKSPNIKKWFGWEPKELVGVSTWENVHPDDLAPAREFIGNLMDEPNATGTIQCRYRCKNDSYKWIELSGVNLLHDPDVQGIIGNYHDITARKQSEDALRESETRFRALHNASFGGISIHDKGKILECNQGLSNITGYSTDELIGMDGLLLISEKTRDMVLNNILSGYETPYEAIGIRKNNEEYPVRLEARNIPYKGKNVRVVEFRDITESKKAEKALRESEKKYRLIAENMSDVISILDMNLQFTYVSPSIKHLTGFTVEEAIQQSIEEIITPESFKNVMKVFEEEMMLEASGTADPARKRIIEIEQSKKDISIVWVEVACSFIRDAERKPTGILLVSRDITERKNAEAERERLMTAIEHSGEVIVITDTDGTIQYVNPAFEKVTGYSHAETIGQNPNILKSMHHNDLFYQQLWKTISSGKIWSGRMVNKKKDGSFYTEDATISPVYNPEGDIINYVAAKKDITEHLRVHEQLHQAQKMESVGRLAGGVAHDFNNLLSVILGFTEMAMDKVDPDSLLYDDLSEVFNAANRSTGIVQQLLAFARKQIISPKILNLNDTVADMIKMLQRLIGEDIDFIWKPGKDVWPVKMDPSQTDQILANLCVNARDAISDIGTITIETHNTMIDEQYCKKHRYFVPGEYVMLTVNDTGSGMDQEIADKIFEPFFTTKETGKGTGLGLSTVYGIMKQNNGFINCESNPGQGTTFAIFLPRHRDKAEQLIEEKASKTPKPGNETILLVEDEQAILKMTARMLEKLGYVVIKANTPGDAIHLARKHNGEIHLLMTDIVMPEMNGRDLARNILSIYPNISRLFMSGYTSDVIARHGVLEAGVHFIHKPFSIANLAPKLREALDQDQENDKQ